MEIIFIETKLTRSSNIELFVVFVKEDFYEMIKHDNWKNHKTNIDQYFIKYNDEYKAMEFKIPFLIKNNFEENLNKMMDIQIRLYEMSNVSYEEYKLEQQKKEKRKL